MKVEIKINNKAFQLEEVSNINERKENIENFLQTELELATGKMTVEEYYTHTWDKPTTKTSLDRIGYYLSKMPEQNGKVDKEVLNKHQVTEMEKGIRYTTKRKENLTEADLEYLGLTKEEVESNPKKRYNVYVKTSAVHYDDMSLEEKINTGLAEVEETD